MQRKIQPRTSRRNAIPASVLVALLGVSGSVVLGSPQYQQEPTTSTLFSDNFSSGFSNWTVLANTTGRTVFGQKPTLVTGASGSVPTYAQFKVDTYDPTAAGTSILGTQIQTNSTFGLPTSGGQTTGQGVQFQIVSRVESTGLLGPAGRAGDTSMTTAAGLNAADFTYVYSEPAKSNYLNEIDIENLTSQQSPPTVANPTGATTHSNTYFTTSTGDATLDTSYNTRADSAKDNSYYAQTPYAPGDTGSVVTPIDIYDWHTYDLDWYPNQIDWYVDGQLVREEAADELSTTNPTLYVPTHAMAFYLDFWAPSSGFKDAYSASLTAASTAALNEEFYYDTADASVSVLAPLGTAVPEPGSGMVLVLMGAGMVLRRARRIDATAH